MSKQDTPHKRKHLTSSNLKTEIIRRLESGKSQRDTASYNIGSSITYDIKKQRDHYDRLCHEVKV
jgi:hypothetical protein